jgi:hypothetical protein
VYTMLGQTIGESSDEDAGTGAPMKHIALVAEYTATFAPHRATTAALKHSSDALGSEWLTHVRDGFKSSAWNR